MESSVNKNCKVWVLTELFYPEQTSTAFILTRIAYYLQQFNSVEVITEFIGNNNENLSSPYNFNVHYVKSSIQNKKNFILRMVRLLTLSFKIFLKALFSVSTGDKVLLVTNPAPLLLLVPILKWIRKVEIVLIIHDVFPENAYAAGIFSTKKNLFYLFIKKVFDWAYSKVDYLIVLGRDMKRIVASKISNKRNNKIFIITNWADLKDVYPLTNTLNSQKIIIGYAGNIGRLQGLESFILKFKDIKNDKVYFHIHGSGVLEEEIKDLVRKHNLQDRVIFFGQFSRNDQLSILNSFTIGLVSLDQKMFGLGVPSKTYNLLAAGKPILYMGPIGSEVWELINEHDIGFNFEHDNHEAFNSFFNREIEEINLDINRVQSKSRSTAELIYSEEAVISKYNQIFK